MTAAPRVHGDRVAVAPLAHGGLVAGGQRRATPSGRAWPGGQRRATPSGRAWP